MSETTESSVVGVVGTRTDGVRSAVEDAGAAVEVRDQQADLAPETDAVVAVGESALLDLAAKDPTPDVPVLPVEAGPGVGSVPRSAVASAVDHLVDGNRSTHPAPVLGAVVDGTERARALCDLMLVTAEPARISEYSVRTGETQVAQFRADGVVVATPAGTHGYARTVGAPVVDHRADVVATAPIAPFATDADHWILPADTVSLRVERDEAPVELLADDRRIGPVDPYTDLSVTQVDSLRLCSVPESRPPFDVS